MHTEAPIPRKRASLNKLVAAGLIAMAASVPAFAQATNTTDTATPPAAAPSSDTKKEDVVVMSEFTVAGSYAGSLAMAAEEKESAPGIIEAIAPEDIGKLPDVSIADALARLPGLTSQRVNGRDQQITIRGLSPDFSVGTLDGVEQASTNDNRAI
jgi:iron complex outermembrane receptor protein